MQLLILYVKFTLGKIKMWKTRVIKNKDRSVPPSVQHGSNKIVMRHNFKSVVV